MSVPRGKQRALLAALLLNADRLLPVPYLIEVLWGAEPPPSAEVSLQNYVKRLRAALGQAGRTRVRTFPRGYLFHLEPHELDVVRAEELLRSARMAARDGWQEQASRLAAEAISLWCGEPLADVNSQVLELQEVPRLREIRLQLLETRLEADLQLGHHHDVIAELTHFTAAHPLRERPYALLMLALYRCDRRGDALATYQHARRILVEELGSEPGAGLREVHRQILADDPSVADPESAGLRRTGSDHARPRQLPPAVPAFIGRDAELTALDKLLNCATTSTAASVAIAVIGGMAGVGKTALAVHWANRVIGHFPDGQLYVNLRGYAAAKPLTSADALARFLRALGMPGPEIPADIDERAAAYRSLLARRRMLVVLDNAREAEQVRPLLPASPGCATVVTSRSPLRGLVATEAALAITLDVLTHTEAYDLLSSRLGRSRLADEPTAVTDLIALCARLPLALCIVAAQALVRPSHPLAALTSELGHARQWLDVLDAGETAVNVREVFSWSYRHLSPSAARMFRLLGMHPGPDITVPAAAVLSGTSVLGVLRILTELTGAHMLTEHLPGRYAFHDLLRAYAAERGCQEDDAAAPRTAIGRVLDYYLHTAYAADRLLYPFRQPLALHPAPVSDELASEPHAETWLRAEHAVLMEIIVTAEEMRLDRYAWQLPLCISMFLDVHGHWEDFAAIGQIALRAARRLEDAAAQARIHVISAYACMKLDYRDAVHAHLNDALGLYRKLGERVGQAHVHLALCKVLQREGRYREGLSHAQYALVLHKSVDDRAGEAIALDTVGWTHAHLGRPQLALSCCWRALRLHREVGNRIGEAGTWDSLGYAHHKAVRYQEATDCYRRSIAAYHEVAAELEEACVRVRLGDTYLASGRFGQARNAWGKALATLDEANHPYTHRVRSRLQQLNNAADSGLNGTRELVNAWSFEPVDTA